tara:strand:+ start:435 stop:599 length:165 start_codon:yes stop_codon:yes gene_type:complete
MWQTLPPPLLGFLTSCYIPKKLTNLVTDWSVSQVSDEVLYTGLTEMQELPEHEE